MKKEKKLNILSMEWKRIKTKYNKRQKTKRWRGKSRIYKREKNIIQKERNK
jgi:hypothetical protein